MYIYLDSYDYDKAYEIIKFIKRKGVEFHVIPEKNLIAEYKVRKCINDLMLEEVPYSDYNLKKYHIDKFKEMCSKDESKSLLIGLLINLLIGQDRYVLETEFSSALRCVLELEQNELEKFS